MLLYVYMAVPVVAFNKYCDAPTIHQATLPSFCTAPAVATVHVIGHKPLLLAFAFARIFYGLYYA